MTEKDALIILNSITSLSYIKVIRLAEYFGSYVNILKADINSLKKLKGIGQRTAEVIELEKAKFDLQAEYVLARKSDCKIITILDNNYPKILKNIYDPPLVLYVKGNLLADDRYAVSIVGSRKASDYGLQSAETIAKNLSLRGITIISGLARGIDTAAHRGAVKAGTRTIAVLGSGIAKLYPPENRKLAENIAKNGAVISEFPMLMSPLKENFPRRNRIVSGLSVGIVVVEAAYRSGSLITAKYALDEGREVFAVPGKVDSLTSKGTNKLIKEGAKLVENVDDILDELNIEMYS